MQDRRTCLSLPQPVLAHLLGAKAAISEEAAIFSPSNHASEQCLTRLLKQAASLQGQLHRDWLRRSQKRVAQLQVTGGCMQVLLSTTLAASGQRLCGRTAGRRTCCHHPRGDLKLPPGTMRHHVALWKYAQWQGHRGCCRGAKFFGVQNWLGMRCNKAPLPGCCWLWLPHLWLLLCASSATSVLLRDWMLLASVSLVSDSFWVSRSQFQLKSGRGAPKPHP